MTDEPDDPIVSLHMAISPISFASIDDWIGWRTRRYDRLHGVDSIVAHQGETGGTADWSSSWQHAFTASRRLPGELVALPGLLESLDVGLSRLRSHLPVDAVRTWLLACREFGPCILTVCVFRGVAPEQADVRTALFSSFGGDRIDLASHLKAGAGSWFETSADLFIETERTHLVSLYRFADVDDAAAKAEFSKYLSCHLQDDGNAKNFAGAYRHPHSNLTYAHAGYSYSTFAAPTTEEIFPFVPTCCIAQLSWAVQRSIERYFRGRSWDPALTRSSSGNPGAATMLASFERIKLELKLFEIERLAFREALPEWQQRLSSRFVTHWQIDESSRLLEEASDEISSFLDASVKVGASEASTRQNVVLYIIALLGVLGLASTISAYNDVLSDTPFLVSVHKATLYVWAVGGFFVTTMALTGAGIYFGILRKR